MYVGKELECKIIELDRNRNNVVLSRRAFLEDLSPIAEAPNLEHFAMTGMTKCLPENFEPFVDHKTLKDIWVGLGSIKKNRAVAKLFAGSRIAVKSPSFAEVQSTN